MTWGVLPELPAFEKHVRTALDEDDEPVIGPPGDVYHMELVSKEKEWAKTALETLFATGTPLAFDQFTPKKYPHKYGLRFHDVPSLHKFILALLTVDEMEAEAQGEQYGQGNEETPGMLASSIMSTLGYEWI
jgi:hypothetical protein